MKKVIGVDAECPSLSVPLTVRCESRVNHVITYY